LWLAALGLLLPGQVRARRAKEPLPLPPPPSPEAHTLPGELAPLPDRRIEAPHQAEPAPRPELEPTIITPRQQQRGQTFGPEHAPANDDLLFREPAVGARLRIPFSY
jgi:hypothetical protein